jgi:hypothetical protein
MAWYHTASDSDSFFLVTLSFFALMRASPEKLSADPKRAAEALGEV